jgi:hypothetical protein
MVTDIFPVDITEMKSNLFLVCRRNHQVISLYECENHSFPIRDTYKELQREDLLMPICGIDVRSGFRRKD